MESQHKNIILGLKMMVKSCVAKFILNSHHAGRWLFLLLNLWFWEFYEVRKNSFQHGKILKIFFLDHFSSSCLGWKWHFLVEIPFEGKKDVWISQVRRLNPDCHELRKQEKCSSLAPPRSHQGTSLIRLNEPERESN